MTPPLTFPPRPALPLTGGSWSDVPGARCGVAKGRIKLRADRDDVVVLFTPGGSVAGVTTLSTAAAAPCRWTRDRLPGRASAVVINSGNANAATGRQGEADTLATAQAVAEALGLQADEVLVCSTGVIGQPMPMDRLLPAAREAAANLGDHGHRAARAILTTDLVVKEVSLVVDGVRFGGMAKGSGMIHPNMATMLGFIACDAKVAPEHLQPLVAAICDRTFNAITVDGDTSTNDTFLVQCTGHGKALSPESPGWASFAFGLEVAALELARAIARDGEGATSLVEVVVMGLEDDAQARHAARSIVRSNLLKSAIHGRDPNWGRIVGALGAAGVPHLDALDLDIAGVPVMRGGQVLDWDEAAASAGLRSADVQITARLPGVGLGRAYGCDLSAEYVKINADYRS